MNSKGSEGEAVVILGICLICQGKSPKASKRIACFWAQNCIPELPTNKIGVLFTQLKHGILGFGRVQFHKYYE